MANRERGVIINSSVQHMFMVVAADVFFVGCVAGLLAEGAWVVAEAEDGDDMLLPLGAMVVVVLPMGMLPLVRPATGG